MNAEENLRKLLRAAVPEASRILGRNIRDAGPSWIRVLTEVLLDDDVEPLIGAGLRAYGDAFERRGAGGVGEAPDLRDELDGGLALYQATAGSKACDALVRRFLSGEMTDEVKRAAVETLRAQVGREVRAELRAEIEPELRAKLEKEMRPELVRLITDELRSNLAPDVREELRRKLVEPVREELNEELTRELEQVVQRSTRMQKLATRLVKAGKINGEQASRALTAAAQVAADTEEGAG